MDKYRVSLTSEERNELKMLVTGGKAAARKLTHARILLLADGEDCLDEEIVSALGTSLRTVERVRRRFVTEGLEAAIDHRPHPASAASISVFIKEPPPQGNRAVRFSDEPRRLYYPGRQDNRAGESLPCDARSCRDM